MTQPGTSPLSAAENVALPDQPIAGAPWTDIELDLIVADHFASLADEQAGRAYVKAHRTQTLSELIGRSRKSVEFKHMNLWDEAPPPLREQRAPRPEALERLVRHFDPVERDHRNGVLGEAGEARIVDFERLRPAQADRSDLAAKMLGGERGRRRCGLPHPLLRDGQRREADRGQDHRRRPDHAVCFLTRNERALRAERPDAFRLYRFYDFTRTPRLFQLTPPLEQAVTLEPKTWRAVFGERQQLGSNKPKRLRRDTVSL